MPDGLRILMIASESTPFVKTGGLADVVGALPRALRRRGHDVFVVLPKYSRIDVAKWGLGPFHAPMGVWMGDALEWCAVDRATYLGVPYYFIEHHDYFDREGLYHNGQLDDYPDNARRFAFLARAALQLCIDRGFHIDVVHAHDWQAALAPAYLNVWHRDDPVLSDAAGVLTIHNIGHQGKYHAGDYDYVGLGAAHFTPDRFEDFGMINLLKGGIHFADLVNTVSPSYARETVTTDQGVGMGPFLYAKGAYYTGILNGVDDAEWNPETDSLIPANYDVGDRSGKRICKRALQERFGLDVRDDVPLFGVVSRFAHQKGLDLLAETIEAMVRALDVQFVVLGAGDKVLERLFTALPTQHAGLIGSHIGYHNELSHWIEAGSDFFVMPSLFEPCGLNQLYSMRYGTLPVVRATGGLEDTVQQYDEETGAGTGFKFSDATPHALYEAVWLATETYRYRPVHMDRLIRTAMAQRFSWDASARAYEEAYRRAMARRRSEQ